MGVGGSDEYVGRLTLSGRGGAGRREVALGGSFSIPIRGNVCDDSEKVRCVASDGMRWRCCVSTDSDVFRE
jgi:hypothetical protein